MKILLPLLLLPGMVAAAELHRSVRSDTSAPLAELLAGSEANRAPDAARKPQTVPNRLRPPFFTPLPDRIPIPSTDIQQVELGVGAPPMELDFDGFSNADNVAVAGGLVAPPDPNGDVGTQHYIQYMNLGWRVFDKATGLPAAGPFAGNSFWQGFGGACEFENSGDAIVLHDDFADRWIFAQFAQPLAGGGRQCFAVSATADPLGAYHRYEFEIPFLDYPKLGVFTDGGGNSAYGLTTNNFGGADGGFSGVTLASLDRDTMLAGRPDAAMITFDLPPTDDLLYFAVLPAHLEGPATSAADTCQPFVMAWDDEVWTAQPTPTDGYQLWELCPDFVNPGAARLDGPVFVDAGVEFDMELCGFGPCAPQDDTAQRLDTLSQFTMNRAVLRAGPLDQPDNNVLAVTGTVDVGDDRAGIRWARLRTGAAAAVLDQGIYAPGFAHRFVPSGALDQDGNLAIGYSRSAEDEFPSLRIAGRTIDDPPGLLRDESLCVAGGGVQTGSERWVDYAAMSVDPVDACTFWFTSEYYATTSSIGWATRVCAFSYPECGSERVRVRAIDNTVRQTACVGQPLAPVALEVALSSGETAAVDVTIENAVGGFTFDLPGSGELLAPTALTVGATPTDVAAGGRSGFDVVVTPVAAGAVEAGRRRVVVDVFATVPLAPNRTEPPSGLLDAARRPELRWEAVDGAADYLVEVALDAGFASVVASAVVTETTWQPPTLATGTPHFWRVTARNACGGEPGDAGNFVTAPPSSANVLLVDDDDNTPDVRAAYANALSASGIAFDVWDTGNSDDEPDVNTLVGYDAVVWFTGDEFDEPTGPSPASEAELAKYLDRGGCLLLSSQDYAFRAVGFDTEPNEFMRDYLGVESINGDVGHTRVEGIGLFDAIEETELDYRSAGLPPLGFDDAFTASESGVDLFLGRIANNENVAATGVVDGAFRTFYLGFAAEALDPETRRDALRIALADSCGVLEDVPLGALAGTIRTTGSGTPISGAMVQAERAGITVTVLTDEEGSYRFDALPPGFFQLSASAPLTEGTTALLNVPVSAEETTERPLVLDAAEVATSRGRIEVTQARGEVSRRRVRIDNPGTVDLVFGAGVDGYALGEVPAIEPDLRRGPVLTASSFGPTARVEALPGNDARPPLTRPAVAGDLLTTAPYPEQSPLGATQAPDGTLWVTDLFSGRTVFYDANLFLQGVFDDPIGPMPAETPTTGIAFDTQSDTLWWLSSASNELIEGGLDGLATGRTIPVTVADGGLPAGVEYDPETEAFFYLDIVADDIWAVDRTGAVLPGYPVPQTDLDRGQGLQGNGLDVVDGQLEVLVGEDADRFINRSVLTDRFGRDVGVVTPLEATGDRFINDVVRSRLDPDGVMYLVGNSTRTIYAVEPTSLLLAERWASVAPQNGIVSPGETLDGLVVTFDPGPELPFGEYSAALVLGSNAVVEASPVLLNLVLEGSPALTATLTGYVGADNGARCDDPPVDAIPGEAGVAVVLCLRVENSGDTHLDAIDFELAPRAIGRDDWTLRSGAEPTPAGSSLLFTRTIAVEARAELLTLTVRAEAADADGESIPGPEPAPATAQFAIGDEIIFRSGFE